MSNKIVLDHVCEERWKEALVPSDPLIRTDVKFKLTFVAEMYRRAACILDDHPLESLPFVVVHSLFERALDPDSPPGADPGARA